MGILRPLMSGEAPMTRCEQGKKSDGVRSHDSLARPSANGRVDCQLTIMASGSSRRESQNDCQLTNVGLSGTRKLRGPNVRRLTVSEQLRREIVAAENAKGSLKAVAEESEVDISQLSRFVRGEREIRDETFSRLCKYLKLELRKLGS